METEKFSKNIFELPASLEPPAERIQPTLIPFEHTADENTQGSKNEMESLAVSLNERRLKQLRRIERAKERFLTGKYGRCAECEQKITPDRLKAIPEAEHCVQCKRDQEIYCRHNYAEK